MDVENFVKQCDVCQHVKHERTHPAGLLQPLPIPDGAWRDITMDFIEDLPKSEGYNYIIVVVYKFLVPIQSWNLLVLWHTIWIFLLQV